MRKLRSLAALTIILAGFALGGADVALGQTTDDVEAAHSEVISTGGASYDAGLKAIGAAIGAALVIMGGATGISRIGSSAVESMARQPEAAGPINFAMIVSAAMIEGATLFAVVVCLLAIIL
jgi:F-type H+-transporting ATPase subunit c